MISRYNKMYKIRTLIYILNIIYSKCHSVWFIAYMYFKFYNINKRSHKYKVEVITDEAFWNVLKNDLFCDINNTVIVHGDNIYTTDQILVLCNDYKISRHVFVVRNSSCDKNVLYISNTLFHNAINTNKCVFNILKPLSHVKVANIIKLALLAGTQDVNNAVIDCILEGYFKLPKIVYVGDIISISVKKFAPTYFYSNSKNFMFDKLYFKCIQVLVEGKETSEGCFCINSESTVIQTSNVQSFLPKIFKKDTVVESNGINTCLELNACPDGLDQYFILLSEAVCPFLKMENPKLQPVFLIYGAEGYGDDILLRSVALSLGINHFRIRNCDLTANTYAQNETKLHNIFFMAQQAAPCLLTIQNFQNFGRNNDGQYDQRIIKSFIHNVSTLFQRVTYPVIIFCCSNTKNISPDLQRLFLEIYEIKAPVELEREQVLQWLLIKYGIKLDNSDLKYILNRTHGFYFKDLEALVYYAMKFCIQQEVEGNISPNKNHFKFAIDFMAFSYHESVGAPKVPKVQWSDIGGLNDVKEDVIKTINLRLKYPEIFLKSGLNRSGILLFGPPGTGKTLIAKAVATECSLCFLTVKGPELLNMYVGQSEQNVREVFEKARQAAPCIIFFDELDSLAPNRGISGDSGGVMDRIVSQLLAEMDGLDNTEKVFIIGATNRPDLIDPALLRPGRFDKLLYVGPCTDLESRISIFKALTKNFHFEQNLNVKKVVTLCPENITGADLYGICSMAWSMAAKRLIKKIENAANLRPFNHQEVIINYQDFYEAILKVKPSISKEDLKYFESLKSEFSFNKTDVKIPFEK